MDLMKNLAADVKHIKAEQQIQRENTRQLKQEIQNLRKEQRGYKKEIEELKEINEEARKQINKLTKEVSLSRVRIEKLESEKRRKNIVQGMLIDARNNHRLNEEMKQFIVKEIGVEAVVQ